VLDKKGLHVIQIDPSSKLVMRDIPGDYVGAAFSPDHRMLLVWDRPGIIRRFDISSWREMEPAMKVDHRAGLAFSPDGQWLQLKATRPKSPGPGYIHENRVWRLPTGVEVPGNEPGQKTSDPPASRPPQGGSQALIEQAEHWHN